jgi:hypothetical protein
VTTGVVSAQREIMAKIVAARFAAIDLRLDLDDALTELVNVTAWADDDTPAEQKSALENVVVCRKRLADSEAKIDRLHRQLVECNKVRRP